ncbi:SMC-Scp complex subunit ScpB [Candidatus Micrarchaeota archaeon]|nr:SMC-Scp complex subunit ScpB [Candidatus Micrarchaeota archaeon]
MDEKRIIEAALFISARELSMDDLKKLTGIAAPGFIHKLIEELKNEYAERGSAIDIISINGKYVMNLKENYNEKVKDFAQEVELSPGALKVLGYIYQNKGAVLKSTIAKRLGSWIYPYVKELVQGEFVKAVKHGRTSRLELTDKFHRYFKKEEAD